MAADIEECFVPSDNNPMRNAKRAASVLSEETEIERYPGNDVS